MITDDVEENEDDIDYKELLQGLYENSQDSELTRLTEMVRKHYLNYLEKQLHENLIKSNYNNTKNGVHKEDFDEMCKKSIKRTAELLEDKAVKACMIAKFYQKAMVKIIAVVRRTTDEKKLLTNLEKCIQSRDEHKPLIHSKETQTEAGLLEVFSYKEPFKINEKTLPKISPLENEDDKNISLDDKIEMFKKHLQKDVVKKYNTSNDQKRSKRQHKHHNERNSYRRRHHEEHNTKHKEEFNLSPPSSVVTLTTTTKQKSPEIKQPLLNTSLNECPESDMAMNENSNDSVALELARLFSEEKTELDEIFGIDPNEEPDDPQICKILKEIEEAKIIHTNSTELTSTAATTTTTTTTTESKIVTPQTKHFPQPKKITQEQCTDSSLAVDLSKSIWPCELFRQRRKLSESLARLIEEDLRWYEIIKWKFSELFGEDSDDEFTPCSPSIELNEVLIGSCIRRISPWVVKYLMKPMKDGLIGNRFLFKKLAKNLARSIIMENQYPDEFIIKECVENFFCLHQAVMSLEDLEVYIPSTTSSF